MNTQQPPASRGTRQPSTFSRRLLRALSAALAVLTLSLVAIRPILGPSRASGPDLKTMPCSDDAAFHLLRLTQLDHLIRQGVFFSRWAPDMAQGYGYPFFNFYAPLSYYAAEIVSRLGAGLTSGLLLTFALGILGSGLAMYVLARDHFDKKGAMVAAVAYAYAPYQAYDVLFRGNLAESAAWALLPLALWTMGRLSRSGGRRWLAATALAFAGVLLTHNVFALIFSPLLAAYGMCVAPPPRVRTWARPAGALFLGLGLSAFFWLPALVERSLVHSDRLLVPPIFVYWNNFVRLDEIFAAPRSVHPDLINPSPPRALGLIPTLLALPSLLALLVSGATRFRGWPSRFSRYLPLSDSPDAVEGFSHISRSATIAFFAAALVICVWMMMSASQVVWDTLPLIEFVQFPWRLLGPAALCLALLVGASIDLFPRTRGGTLAAAAAVCVLILSSLFWLDARYCPGFENPNIQALQAFERQSDTIGTTAKGEYLPRTVTVMPHEPAGPLLDPATWPEDVMILESQAGALDAEALVESHAGFRAVVDAFDYPGWQARIDDRRVSINPSPDEGLITFQVPPGRHRLTVRFGEPPLRLAADLLSAACLFLVLVLFLWPRGQTNGVGCSQRPVPTHRQATNWPWTVLGLSLFAVVIWLVPQVNGPLRRPRLSDAGLQGVAVPLAVDFQNELTLLGYGGVDSASDPQIGPSVRSGEQLSIDLYWTARAPAPRPSQTTLTVVGPTGSLWSPKNTTLPRDFRSPPTTPLWQPRAFVEDRHLVSTLPGTPPGDYTLKLTLFDRETLVPFSRLNEAGQPAAPDLDLGTLTVALPPRAPELDKVPMQRRFDVDLGPLRLVGADLDRSEARPGDPILVTLFWQALDQLSQRPELMTQLALVRTGDACGGAAKNQRDGAAAAWELPPVSADWPTSLWRAGDFWRGQHLLRLPATLEDGAYVWRLGLYEPGQQPIQGEQVDLGALCVNAPDRIWEAPPLAHPVSATLSGQVKLLGFDVEPSISALQPHDALTVTLAWQGQTEMATSYSVFLHLLGPAEELIAQADGEPAHWTRPTTGWAPGEIVLDQRVLTIPGDVPPGEYNVLTGMYNPGNGERLVLPDGATVVRLLTFQVQAR